MKKLFAVLFVLSLAGCTTTQGRFIKWPLGSDNVVHFVCSNAEQVGRMCCEASYNKCDIRICKYEDEDYSVDRYECDF